MLLSSKFNSYLDGCGSFNSFFPLPLCTSQSSLRVTTLRMQNEKNLWRPQDPGLCKTVGCIASHLGKLGAIRKGPSDNNTYCHGVFKHPLNNLPTVSFFF